MKVERTYKKETPEERKRRVQETGNSMTEKVIPDKKKYNRKKEKKNSKFESFLDNLKTVNNSNLIESIKKGFKACFENMDMDMDDLEEIARWERLSPEQKDKELNPPKKKRKFNRDPKLWATAKKLYMAKFGGPEITRWDIVNSMYKDLERGTWNN